MLNFNVLYTSLIPYTYYYNTDLSNLIYLPILIHIRNLTTLCLIKEPFKEYYLLINLLFRVFFIYFHTLHNLVLISIITILMCLINRIYYGSPILLLSFYCVIEEQFPFLM